MPIMFNHYSLLCNIYMTTCFGVLSYATGNGTLTEEFSVVIRSLELTNQI
jgi:hypothetical protein